MSGANNKRKFQMKKTVDNTESFPGSRTTILNLPALKYPENIFKIPVWVLSQTN